MSTGICTPTIAPSTNIHRDIHRDMRTNTRTKTRKNTRTSTGWHIVTARSICTRPVGITPPMRTTRPAFRLRRPACRSSAC